MKYKSALSPVSLYFHSRKPYDTVARLAFTVFTVGHRENDEHLDRTTTNVIKMVVALEIGRIGWRWTRWARK